MVPYTVATVVPAWRAATTDPDAVMRSLIRLRDVRRVFHQGRPDELVAVDGVDASTSTTAQVTVLRGPSGSGKTSLLALLGCMARPTSGRIHLGDREVTSLPEHFLTEVRRRTFGFVFQQFHLVRGLIGARERDAAGLPAGRHAARRWRARAAGAARPVRRGRTGPAPGPTGSRAARRSGWPSPGRW